MAPKLRVGRHDGPSLRGCPGPVGEIGGESTLGWQGIAPRLIAREHVGFSPGLVCLDSEQCDHARDRLGSEQLCASQQNRMPNVRFGSKADIASINWDVRFTPKSGHWFYVSGCPLCAKSRPSAMQQKDRYSITSSANSRRVYVSATLMIGRGLSIRDPGDSFASKISVRPTRSYSAEIVRSQ
jgi:hypothetical protein